MASSAQYPGSLSPILSRKKPRRCDTVKTLLKQIVPISESFLEHQREQDENSTTTDVHLICSDGIIPVHAVVLQSVSQFFEKMLKAQGDYYFGYRPLLLPDWTVEEISWMVQFIYTGSVTIVKKEMDQVKELLAYFMISIEPDDLKTEKRMTKPRYTNKSQQILTFRRNALNMFEQTQLEDDSAELEMFPPTPPPIRKRVARASVSTASNVSAKRKKPSSSRSSRLFIDFDKIPRQKSKEPNFQYKPEKAVRKKEERKELPGWDCPCCRDYYEAIQAQMPPEEIEKLKNACSKHRSKHQHLEFQSNTPRYYWDVDFPSTQECIKNGLIRIGERSPTDIQ